MTTHELNIIARQFKNTRDHEDYKQLYNYFKPRLYKYAWTWQLEEQTKEDCVTAVLEKMYMKIDQFNTKWSITSWIYMTMHNELGIQLRIVKNLNNVSLDSESLDTSWHEIIASPIDEEPPEYNPLYKAILELPEHYQEAIILQYWYGMTLQEIAEVMQISVGAAKTRVHNAKRVLRRYLIQDEGG